MLKDHKSAMHLEGVTFDKVIRNSNETEQFLNFLLFYNCQLEIMRFIHSFNNMFLFSNHNVTYMNASMQYNENRGVRALLTIRKHQINLPSSSNFLPKMVPLTGTVPLTYFMGYSESIRWSSSVAFSAVLGCWFQAMVGNFCPVETQINGK